MHVFVTGASGWIGSATVVELLAAGHQVTGLARSTPPRTGSESAGSSRSPATSTILESLRRGAAGADAVIHLANKHDWADPASSNRSRAGRRPDASVTRCSARTGRSSSLRGSPSARAAGSPSRTPRRSADPTLLRGGSETLALGLRRPRVCTASALRFAPTVHGAGDHGFIAEIVRHRPRARGLRLRRRRHQPLAGRARDRRRAAWSSPRPRDGAGRVGGARRRRGGGADAARSPRPSVGASGVPVDLGRTRRTSARTSAGSARSSRSTCRPRARSPASARLVSAPADSDRGSGRRSLLRVSQTTKAGLT